jgi:hypothetical protein
MGRPGPALFELIRGGSAPPPPASLPPGGPGRGAPEKPLVTIRPKAAEPVRAPDPEPEPAAPQPGKPADKAWAAWNKGGSWLDLQKSVTVPMSAILLAVGIGLALLVITWGIAWKVGGNRGEQAATRDLKREEIPVNQGLLVNPPKAPEAKPLPQPQARPQVPAPDAGTAGSVTLVSGMNYKLIASGLDRDSAQEMVDFLNKNGLPSGAAVDKGITGPNNRSSYVVFAAQGLTPDEFKTQPKHPKRDEVDRLLERIGKLWQASKNGRTNLSDAWWKKVAG